MLPHSAPTISVKFAALAEKEYKIHIDKVYVGKMKTNLGGKLNLSVELEEENAVDIFIEKM